jgi:hypothetical protein
MADSEKLWIPDVGWVAENEVTIEQLEARLAHWRKLRGAAPAGAAEQRDEARLAKLTRGPPAPDLNEESDS